MILFLTSRIFFQNPFHRLVKRMTRFHTKKSADKTLYKLQGVLDALKYNFTVNSPRQVRFTLESLFFISQLIKFCIRKLTKTDLEFSVWTIKVTLRTPVARLLHKKE